MFFLILSRFYVFLTFFKFLFERFYIYAENYSKRHNTFIFKTAISISVISNRNSFRVLFDRIASVHLFEKYIYILAQEMASPGNQHCVNCIGTLSFPIARRQTFSCYARTRCLSMCQSAGLFKTLWIDFHEIRKGGSPWYRK